MKKLLFILTCIVFSSYGLDNRQVFDRLLQSFSNDQVSKKESDEGKEAKVSDGMDNPWLQREQLFQLYTDILPALDGVLSLQSVDDLQLYCGSINHPHLSLFSKIDRTVTSFGQGYLAHKLSNPITDIFVLQKGQNRLQRFEQNIKLRESVEAALVAIAEIEPSVYGHWGILDSKVQQSIDNLYFTWLPDSLNKSSVSLEVRTRLFQMLILPQLASDVLFGAIPDLLSKSVGWSNLSYKQIFSKSTFTQIGITFGALRFCKLKQFAWAWAHVRASKEMHFMHRLHAPGTEGYLFGGIPLDEDFLFAIKQISLFEYPVTLLFNAIKIYSLHKSCKEIVASSDLLLSIHAKVNGFATFCRQVEQLKVLVGDAYPFPELSPEMKELYELLTTGTFDCPSRWALAGRVLKAHRLISKHKDQCASLFAWVGAIDADMSMVKLMEEHKDLSASFTYVSYDESDKKVCLAAQDFWNPFIDSATVVTNNISLGQTTKDMNVILTGSNAGGKSTLMKALLFNTILAQTFGVAAAKNFTIKPFSKIYSSMQLVDDLAGGKSRFAAEIDRAKDIVGTLQDSNGPTFLVIDELFTGTSSEKGRRLAGKMLTRLFDSDQCLTLCATHFNELTDLSRTGKCINMRVAAPFKTNAGKLSYPYVLEYGVSVTNVAEDMFDEAIGW
ncbi:MAG TPA: hypothetical protein QGF02_03300 [Candidatus Babeliales bacterium]|nr:hypothetical protein [Candidatus Babeliales bacterium]